jgi:crotonobetainyl-CoA:carnitine CoA-transferase CaiB-like acyl-CoA transferase
MARPAQGDHTTGLALVGAILGGLRLAERTGVGQVVETSLYETAVWTQASDYATTAVDHAPVRQRSRENMLLPTANRYPCGDDKWVVFNMPQASGWAKLCKALGQEAWLEDERFVDARSRYQNMPVLVPLIDGALASKTRDEWGAIFDAAGIIWGPVLGLHEVATDPQAAAINLFPSINDEEIGDYRTVSIPMRFKTADVRPRGRSPKIGEHTRSVLTEFGFDTATIDNLLAGNIIR